MFLEFIWAHKNAIIPTKELGEDNKQLLDEVEHDIMNYQNRGLCYLPKPKAEQITQTRGFDDSWYHAKTEFNNCFIIHFSHNSFSETEAKHSALTSGRRHSTLNKRTPLNKPIVFIVFLVLLSFCLLLLCVSSELCLLHEVRAKHSAILFQRRTFQGA